MSQDPRSTGIPPSASGRSAFEDPGALSRLRRDAFETISVECGVGILYGIGFAEGMFEARRVIRSFEEGSAALAPAGGNGIPMVFSPRSGDLGARFDGSLPVSKEAELHLHDFPASEGPVCFLSAGFAAGWYSGLLDDSILVRETSCRACGAASCHFEARRLEDWLAEGSDWARELLPYLDLEAIREKAEERLDDPDPGEGRPGDAGAEGEMMGEFDPMSPAVHVWGPVMVLPYSGGDDCLLALETVREDVGPDQIRVVVIDATGAVIGASETIGLARLLDVLDSLGLEAVLVGTGEQGTEHFGAQRGALRLPILARCLSEAITLGFQMSLPSR